MKPFYERNGVQILLGDCREILPTLEPVDHVITDPPYDEQTHSRGGNVRRYDNGPAIARIPFAPLEDAELIAAEMARLVRRWSLIFCAVRQIERWAVALESNGVNVPRVLMWVKPDCGPQFSGDRPRHGYESIVLAHPRGKTKWNGGGHAGVYTVNRMDNESGFLHPTQKPVQLIRELVELFTDPGETILDPFAGSCTTGVAAFQLHRKAILIELEEKWAEVGAERLRNLTEPFPLYVPESSEQAVLL